MVIDETSWFNYQIGPFIQYLYVKPIAFPVLIYEDCIMT